MSADVPALVRRLPGCGRLAPEALAVLATQSRLETFPPAAPLVREGEPAPDWYGVVASGAVQLTRVDLEGDEILDYLAEGDVVDPGTPGAPAAWSATAAEATRCLLVPQAAVAQLRGSLTDAEGDVARGELALFVREVVDLVTRAAVTCPAGTSVTAAAQLMTSQRVGSVVVTGPDGAAIGIVTDRDLRTKILAGALSPTTAVGSIMSAPLVAVGARRLAFDALLEMTRRNIHHLGVMDDRRLVGVISSHDVLWLHGAHPVALAREVDSQDTLDGLAAIVPRLQTVVRWLSESGAGPFAIGKIVAELNDRVVRRVVSLIEAALEREGHGRPPVEYSWVAAGSEGRREQTLKTDQDNGLVYEDSPEERRQASAAYFRRLAARIGDALVRVGFPTCPGGFMASNPRWCQPASVWQRYFDRWMSTPQPRAVLSAALFFDLRPVAAADGPALALRDWVCRLAPSRTLFLQHMARAAADRQPPLGVFGSLVVERSGTHRHTLDLKARGVLPFTQAMRVHALSLGIEETNTVERLVQAGERGAFTDVEVREFREAYEVICRLRLAHQLASLAAGGPADNFVNPDTLGKSDRLLLKEAFKSLGSLQRGLEERFLTAALG